MSVQARAMSRREFLYYLWGASMALVLAESGGALVWFALPRFKPVKPGEFGGTFTVPLDQAPPVDGAPVEYPGGRFWLVNLGEQSMSDSRHPPGFGPRPGVLALYKVCVHLGCLYQWKPTNDRFECPCHGSKYLKDGTRVHLPANRNLDVFLIRAMNAQGEVLAETKTGNSDDDPTAGVPIAIPAGTVALQVDTSKRIKGRRNDGPDTVGD